MTENVLINKVCTPAQLLMNSLVTYDISYIFTQYFLHLRLHHCWAQRPSSWCLQAVRMAFLTPPGPAWFPTELQPSNLWGRDQALLALLAPPHTLPSWLHTQVHWRRVWNKMIITDTIKCNFYRKCTQDKEVLDLIYGARHSMNAKLYISLYVCITVYPCGNRYVQQR